MKAKLTECVLSITEDFCHVTKIRLNDELFNTQCEKSCFFNIKEIMPCDVQFAELQCHTVMSHKYSQ